MSNGLIRLIKSELVFRVGHFLPLPIRKGPLAGKWFRGVFFYNRRSQEWNEEERIYNALDLVGRTVIEVGAHIGLYSVMLSQRVGKRGRVIAVEPNPVNYKLLRSNLRLNRCTNALPVEAGVGSENGQLKLVANRYATATGTFKRDKHERFREKSINLIEAVVPVMTLDEIIRKHDLTEVDFVKIDTEGFEPQVIQGMDAVLNKFSPLIYFELHGMNLAQKIDDFAAISERLNKRDYTITICTRDFPIATIEQIQARGGCACLAHKGSDRQIELAKAALS